MVNINQFPLGSRPPPYQLNKQTCISFLPLPSPVTLDLGCSPLLPAPIRSEPTAGFLQGLVTNDVDLLVAGEAASIYTFFLNVSGATSSHGTSPRSPHVAPHARTPAT